MIDFKEVPSPNKATGSQDSWELFCREFLIIYGFKIIEGPSRGADTVAEGFDLIVEESLHDDINQVSLKWAVSCKHLAHSGSAVTDSDEKSIARIANSSCEGLICFYSTIISSGLDGELKKIRENTKKKVLIFDKAKIELLLTSESKYENIFKHYFPESFKRWKEYEEINSLSSNNKWERLTKNELDKELSLSYVKKYYEGAPASWSIIEKYTFQRDLFNDIINAVENKDITLILGAGGEGKSTLLMQVGIYFHKKGYDVFRIDQSHSNLSDIFKKLKRTNTLLIIDNSSDFENLEEFLQSVAINTHTTVLLGARKNEWKIFLRTSKNTLNISKYISKEFELEKLSSSEINKLELLLSSQGILKNESQSEFENVLRDSSRTFLLAFMIAATHGKPFEDILKDVINKIFTYSDDTLSLKALLALGIIVSLEKMPGINLEGLFCNEKLLFESLNLSKKDYLLVRELIIGEAFIQPNNKRLITRNPIVSDIYYRILFESDINYLSLIDVNYDLLRAAVLIGGKFEYFLLSYIPEYYLNNGQVEIANKLYDYCISFGVIPNGYSKILKFIAKNLNIQIETDYNFIASKLLNAYRRKPDDVDLLLFWASIEIERENIGAYDLKYSARWLLRNAYEVNPKSGEIYFKWAALECRNANIGDFNKPNSAKWILKKGIEKTKDGSVYLELAKLEIEAGNIGEFNKPNSAKWILKKGIDKSNFGPLYLELAKLEIEAGNIGEFNKPNSAKWILKNGIDKSVNTLILLAILEYWSNNIGGETENNTARYWLSKAFSMSKDNSIFFNGFQYSSLLDFEAFIMDYFSLKKNLTSLLKY